MIYKYLKSLSLPFNKPFYLVYSSMDQQSVYSMGNLLFLCFPFLSFPLEEGTCNLSSSTVMDILRNKTQTRKVSNQQHIFQKMADPILYMSLRLPSNCWCADPSLIWRCFSRPSRSFLRLFLSFTTCEMGLSWKNANKVSYWCTVQHLEDMQTCSAKLQIMRIRQKRWSISQFWHLAR